MLDLELFFYNPNYNQYIYATLEFVFKPNGELEIQTFYYIDNPLLRLKVPLLTLFSIYLAFTLFYIVRQTIIIKSKWNEITEEEESHNRFNESDCWSKFLYFIGIDKRKF